MAELDKTQVLASQTCFSNQQLEKALNALLKHMASSKEGEQPKQKLSLLPSEAQSEAIFFQITTKHILSTDTLNPTLKPLTIPLPHSPYPPSSTALVITKDPHDKFAEKCKGNPRVQQVIGMGAIRNNFKSFEQLRRLRDGEIVGEEPALVLADENVVLTLPRLLGKAFYKTPRTTPISVRITPATISKVVEEAFNKSYVRRNAGNCVAVRIGHAGMSVEQLVENCVAMWERCVNQQKLVKTGLQDVRSGFIKSGSSVALPVWVNDKFYSEEDVLDGQPAVKEAKSKAERKLVAPSVIEKEEASVGIKREREDDVEKSYEEKRARKLAKKASRSQATGQQEAAG